MRSIIERLDRRNLLHLEYLFCNYFAAPFIQPVSVGVGFGADDLIESAVYKLYSAVVLNRDTDAPGLANHVPKMFSPRDSSRHTVVVRAMYSLYEPETFYTYVLPFSGVVK